MLPSATDAATYYVATNGSDSNAGTITSPFRTINKGLSALTSGDTLMVNPGTYIEGIFNGVPSGTSGAYTTIKATAPGVFLAPANPNPGYGAGIYLSGVASYIRFDGIGTDGSNHTSLDWPGCCGIAIGGAVDENSIHHVEFLNAEFKNNKCGSSFVSHAGSILIKGNWFHGDQCNSYSHGLYVGERVTITVDNNIVDGFTDYGIQFYSATGIGPHDSIVSNNIFRNNGYGGGGTYLGSGMTIGGVNNLIFNNIAYGNAGGGFAVQYAGANSNKVYNNTAYNNRGWYGFYVGGSAVNSIIKNNISYSNPTGNFQDAGSNTTQSNNLFTSNPNFVNSTANDFHLQSTSPAINYGVILSEFTTDKDGNTRVGNYDIGAYEYGGTVSSTLQGDINNDHIVNSLDWSLMSAKWLTADANADLNKDGAVNSLDWSIMSNNWLKTI